MQIGDSDSSNRVNWQISLTPARLESQKKIGKQLYSKATQSPKSARRYRGTTAETGLDLKCLLQSWRSGTWFFFPATEQEPALVGQPFFGCIGRRAGQEVLANNLWIKPKDPNSQGMRWEYFIIVYYSQFPNKDENWFASLQWQIHFHPPCKRIDFHLIANPFSPL